MYFQFNQIVFSICLHCTSSLITLYFQFTYIVLPICLYCTSNLLILYFQFSYIILPIYSYCTSNLLILYFQFDYIVPPIKIYCTSNLTILYFQFDYIVLTRSDSCYSWFTDYVIFRTPSNLNNSNYYHLGSRLGGTGNYHMMDNNPYNTTLSVPIAQSLQGGYNNARVGRVKISLYESWKIYLRMPQLEYHTLI